jgi:hypothetical protein
MVKALERMSESCSNGGKIDHATSMFLDLLQGRQVSGKTYLLKRRTTMAEAMDLSHLVAPNAEDDFVVVNKKSLENVLRHINTVEVNDLTVRIDPEKQTLWIWINSGPGEGEGGQFNLDDFSKAVKEFYKENF